MPRRAGEPTTEPTDAGTGPTTAVVSDGPGGGEDSGSLEDTGAPRGVLPLAIVGVLVLLGGATILARGRRGR